jgi:hypothetical protein
MYVDGLNKEEINSAKRMEGGKGPIFDEVKP